MASVTETIEFSEDLSTKIVGGKAIAQRIQYRLSVVAGEVPYDEVSIESVLFSMNVREQFERAVRRRLSDISQNITVTEDGRVLAANVSVDITDLHKVAI